MKEFRLEKAILHRVIVCDKLIMKDETHASIRNHFEVGLQGKFTDLI